MGKLYIDKRYFAESKTKWVSFETDPRLKRTKKDIYGKCVPCIMNLYEQLMAGKMEIELGSAFFCWKIVVLMKDSDECMMFLSEFEKDIPEDMYIKGRFGSGDASKDTKAFPMYLQKTRLSLYFLYFLRQKNPMFSCRPWAFAAGQVRTDTCSSI